MELPRDSSKNFAFYKALAERVWFDGGITQDEIPSTCSLRNGKQFSDIDDAVKKGQLAAMGKSTETLFALIAEELAQVIEIKPQKEEKLVDYMKRIHK